LSFQASRQISQATRPASAGGIITFPGMWQDAFKEDVVNGTNRNAGQEQFI